MHRLLTTQQRYTSTHCEVLYLFNVVVAQIQLLKERHQLLETNIVLYSIAILYYNFH